MGDKASFEYIVDLWNTISTKRGFSLLEHLYKNKETSVFHAKIDNELGFDPTLYIKKLIELGIVIPTYRPKRTDLKSDAKMHRITKASSISYLGQELYKDLLNYHEVLCTYEYVNNNNDSIDTLTRKMYEAREEKELLSFEEESYEHTVYLRDFLDKYSVKKCYKSFDGIDVLYNEEDFKASVNSKKIIDRLNFTEKSEKKIKKSTENTCKKIEEEIKSFSIRKNSPLWNLLEKYLEGKTICSRKEILQNTSYKKDVSKFYKTDTIKDAFESGSLMVFKNNDEECISFTPKIQRLINIFNDASNLYNSNWYQSIRSAVQTDQANQTINPSYTYDKNIQEQLIGKYIQIEIYEKIAKNGISNNPYAEVSIFNQISHNKIDEYSGNISRKVGDFYGRTTLDFTLSEEIKDAKTIVTEAITAKLNPVINDVCFKDRYVDSTNQPHLVLEISFVYRAGDNR